MNFSEAIFRDNQQLNQDNTYPTLFITARLMNETSMLLRSFAESTPSEGVVYWFGFEAKTKSVVTTLIVPETQSTWGCIKTTAEANGRVLNAIIDSPLVLLGQAHSHPRHRVRHSDIDNRDTFASFDGAISVVVPFYGKHGMRLGRCGVHRHMRGQFQVISPKLLDEHIKVIPETIDLRI